MNIEKIKQIMELFENSAVSDMELEVDDIKIKLGKHNTSSMPVSIQTIPSTSLSALHTEECSKEIKEQKVEKDYIRSMLVGTFYAAPSANSDPYVKEGDAVKKGDVICIIEAMKVMNEIRAPKDCVIIRILAKNGEMVEFDEPLMEIGDVYD